MQDSKQALQMLDAFNNVGATNFDVTFWTSTARSADSARIRRHGSLETRCPCSSPASPSAATAWSSARTGKEGVTLVQIDDLDAQALERLKEVAFLTLQTSPGNHQAWVAVSASRDPKDVARRLRKQTGADNSASGSTRVAGTLNYKRKYEPDFPTVCIVSTAPDRIVTAQYLEQLGLLSPPEPVKPAPSLRVSRLRDPQWPSYQRCLEGDPSITGKRRRIPAAPIVSGVFSPRSAGGQSMT
jgi:hypothetical protein